MSIKERIRIGIVRWLKIDRAFLETHTMIRKNQNDLCKALNRLESDATKVNREARRLDRLKEGA